MGLVLLRDYEKWTRFFGNLVLLRDYEDWISPWHEAETTLYHALAKREGIEGKADAMLARYSYNGSFFRAQLIPYRRIGVQGDARTYSPALLVSAALSGGEIRGIAKNICMMREMSPQETEKALKMPYAVVADEISSMITRELEGINTVLWEIKDGKE